MVCTGGLRNRRVPFPIDTSKGDHRVEAAGKKYRTVGTTSGAGRSEVLKLSIIHTVDRGMANFGVSY